MKAKIARWGNSLALRLPAEVVRDFGLKEGRSSRSPRTSQDRDRDRAAVVNGIPVYTLEELLAEADRIGWADAEPEMLDWGPDRGSEIIDDEYSRGEIGSDSPGLRDAA